MTTKRLERILECYEELGENEREVLLTFVNRLHQGQKAYGKLYLGKKRWSWEAYEEAMDLAVYAACGMNEENGRMKGEIPKTEVEPNNGRFPDWTIEPKQNQDSVA